ncbi:hypothetical protein RBH29_16395 [Herbivorax sp. ANBcel31]|uniref:hypothetical protein n=1 Tax=Herbivorax sp. ANBcel31 TaxID=3069754 RepID=UPI0027B43831|nr:hypothetical protein [Herbivorax sp. ANBcel31]MDQ2088010.1 hypothetical protein [Herbivorax sp. ANBcel31]
MSSFKKVLSIIIVLCMVFTPILALDDISKVYGSNDGILYGDINDDGVIDSTD